MRELDRDESLDSAGLLVDPVRRRLYDHVARAGDDVGRDDAARGARIARALAAFHLDKLVAGGLLEATYRRLRGRGGPGAGRPSKVYRRASREVSLSLPARRYQTAAELLADAIEQSGSRRAARALRDGAREVGRRLGTDVADIAGARGTRDARLRAAERVLRESGYEPFRDGTMLRLRNCPFDALARQHRDLVCGMNLSLAEGLVQESGVTGLHAELDPGEGHCCVAFQGVS